MAFKDEARLIDKFHKKCMGDKELHPLLDPIRRSHRFILDDAMSAFMADLGWAFFTPGNKVVHPAKKINQNIRIYRQAKNSYRLRLQEPFS